MARIFLPIIIPVICFWVLLGVLMPKIRLAVNDATQVSQAASVWQVKTALELYRQDYEHYPVMLSSQDLLDELEQNGYIEARCKNIPAFLYEPFSDGQDYTLRVTKN